MEMDTVLQEFVLANTIQDYSGSCVHITLMLHLLNINWWVTCEFLGGTMKSNINLIHDQ